MNKWKPEIDAKRCASCLKCARMLSFVTLATGKPEIDENKFFLLVSTKEQALFEISLMVQRCCPNAAFAVRE